ncbi:hypothetical protein KAJ27_09575 [bacterium]|nr:hypothetical protein [bacterium]
MKKHKKYLLILAIVVTIIIIFAGNYGLFVFHGPPGKIKLISKKTFTLRHIIIKCDNYYKDRKTGKTDFFTNLILINNQMKSDGLLETFDDAQIKIFSTTLLKDLEKIK